MIWKIAKKEFLLNLVSARFAVGSILCLLLIPFTVTVNIDDYANRMRAYRVDRDNAERDFREVRVYSQVRPEIVKPPEPLSIFCHGISSNIGSRVKVMLGEKPLFAAGNVAVRDNPLLNSFFSIDFTGILAIVVSLLALIFTYDTCTREKEDGTLRLQLANSLGRSRLLLGKIAGLCLTLLPIVVFCYLLSFLSVLISRQISFSPSDWGRIILLFLTSLPYFLVFAFIGILVSTRVKSSITSIIVCLFLWVLFLFIIPNLAVYLAAGFKKIQSLDNFNYAMAVLDYEYQNKCNEYNQTLPYVDWNMNWNFTGMPDGTKIMAGCTRSKFERYLRECEFSEPLRIAYGDKKWPLQQGYLDQLDRQRKLAEAIALVSPSEIFRLIGRALCRTDVDSHHRFMDGVRRYREVLIGYFEDKKIFSSYLYFTPQLPETFMTADEIVRISTGGEFQTLREFGASGAGLKALFKVKIPGTDFNDYPFLDLSDVPRFQWQAGSLTADMRGVATKIGILAIVCVFLFGLSFASFVRCDVR